MMLNFRPKHKNTQYMYSLPLLWEGRYLTQLPLHSFIHLANNNIAHTHNCHRCWCQHKVDSVCRWSTYFIREPSTLRLPAGTLSDWVQHINLKSKRERYCYLCFVNEKNTLFHMITFNEMHDWLTIIYTVNMVKLAHPVCQWYIHYSLTLHGSIMYI